MTKLRPTTETPGDVNFFITTSMRWTNANIEEYIGDFEDPAALDRQLLPLHCDRLAATAVALKWDNVTDIFGEESGKLYLETKIDKYIRSLPKPKHGLAFIYKLRVLVSNTAKIIFDTIVMEERDVLANPQSPLIPKHLTLLGPSGRISCKVYIDKKPTSKSLFTTHKTSSRHVYDIARERVGVSKSGPMQAEVLIWNHNHEVMEGSLSTLYFLRNGTWYTPPLSSGGNAGVTRRKALEDGLCQEGIIELNSLKDGEMLWLSNGVRGFFPGQVFVAKSL